MSSGAMRGVPAAFLAFVALGALAAALGASLPALRETHGLGPADGGELVSVFNAGALVATVGFGLVGLRLRQAPLLTALVLVVAVAGVGMGIASSWGPLLAAAALAGFGFGGLVVSLNTAFARGFGDRRVIMLNLLNAAYGVGAIGGPLVVGLVPKDSASTVYVGIGLVVLLCLPVRGCAPPPDGDARSAAGTPRRLVPVLAAFAAVGLVYAATETGVGAWESTHLVSIGHSAAAAARITAAFWAGLTIGRFVLPFVFSRVAPPRLVAAGAAGSAVALAMAGVPALAPYAYAAAGFALAPVLPTTLAWLATVAPSVHSASAVVLTACMLGSAGSPTLVGVAVDNGGTGTAIPLTLTAVAFACLVAIVVAARVSSSAVGRAPVAGAAPTGR